MRFLAADGSVVHLSYCSNVHPAETAAGVIAQLTEFAGPVRAHLSWERLGVGLWLSAAAARELETTPRRLAELRSALSRHCLEVVTLNGFPFGGFHDPVVKHAVYAPDWRTEARAEHTVRLARLLAQLLPDDVSQGTISTLPLGYRTPWDASATEECLRRLAAVDDALADLQSETGKCILIAVEAEPGCVLETTAQVTELLLRLGRSHVQVCVDTAHLAVQFEDPRTVITEAARRVGVPKVQLAVALQTPDPGRSRALLEQHDEPRFLHQVREESPGGLLGTDDLPEALAGALPGTGAWRVHVHLPVHTDAPWTTVDQLQQSLAVLFDGPAPLTHSLEVETYTWTVLPEGLRSTAGDGLVAGLAAELAWVRTRLEALGLKEAAAA